MARTKWRGGFRDRPIGVPNQEKRKKVKKDNATSKNVLNADSNDDVLLADVRALIASYAEEAASSHAASPEGQKEIDLHLSDDRKSQVKVKIEAISSSGDGLGLSPELDHVYVIPFTTIGDVVHGRPYSHKKEHNYSHADFLEVVEPSSKRDDTRIECPYFAKCSGCQFQMLSYEDQLIHKKSIIERAYRNFSTLIPEYIPEVGETIGSPLQYGYRTKLTPHFDGPPGSNSKKGRREGVAFTEVPNIGFMQKGTRKTIDIEDCPIGTDAVRKGMKYERSRVANDLAKYKRGATLLLRESTKRMSKDLAIQQPGTSNDPPEEQNKSLPIRGPPSLDLDPNPSDVPIIRTEHESYTEEKTCITDSNATSTEYIDAFKLSNKAGAFFQNNNSILPIFTAYIRSHALPSGSSPDLQPWHLIDAYCGSGLFTITLSSLFSTSTGIDISPASITSANANATANKIPNSKFTTTDASALFKNVSTPPDFTVVIIDPPRKGCDMPFLEQLLRYGPKRIVYVSCNVHTQARDVGVLVEGGRGGGGGGGGGRGVTRYEIESLQGFDFFPQTGHVEGVAVLNRSVGTESMEDDNAMKEAAVVVGSDGEEEGKEAGFTSDKINSTDVDTKHDHDAEQNDGSDSDPDGGVLLKRKRSE